jgi:hypothetical protein
MNASPLAAGDVSTESVRLAKKKTYSRDVPLKEWDARVRDDSTEVLQKEGRRESSFAKEKNKKDLMGSSESEVAGGISTILGPYRNTVPTKSGPKR